MWYALSRRSLRKVAKKGLKAGMLSQRTAACSSADHTRQLLSFESLIRGFRRDGCVAGKRIATQQRATWACFVVGYLQYKNTLHCHPSDAYLASV